MTTLLDGVTVLSIAVGLFFFMAGTVGLLRFPDAHTRLHALTKADNLGLGFVTLGLALQAADLWMAVKMILIWVLVMAAAATVAQLVARLELTGRAGPESGD